MATPYTIRHSTNIILSIYVAAIHIFALTCTANAYEDAAHQDIGAKAKSIYLSFAIDNPDTAVGSMAITDSQNWSRVTWALTHEDDSPLYFMHFYNPDTKSGLILTPDRIPDSGWPEIGTPMSAVERATDLWNNALTEYRSGNYQSAYANLGRVAHLVMDMGVPAHTNNDPHGLAYIPGDDYYEHSYCNRVRPPAPNQYTITSQPVVSIMDNLARNSHRFDSDKADGSEDKGARNNSYNDIGILLSTWDGITDGECVDISSSCYRDAIVSVASLFRRFYDTVKPTVVRYRPTYAQVHSGRIGVPFVAMAHEYAKDFSDSERISHVYIECAEVDNPSPSDWYLIGVKRYRETDLSYIYKWMNVIDDDKVWIRVVAVDLGFCDSIPDRTWISLDQTRPQVKLYLSTGGDQ